jgi:hypothetical protein
MATVKITRATNRFRRSVNGAWMNNGTDLDHFEMDESQLTPEFGKSGVGHGIDVTWPDGVREQAFPFGGGACVGYAPTCIPIDGRLSKLLVRRIAAPSINN